MHPYALWSRWIRLRNTYTLGDTISSFLTIKDDKAYYRKCLKCKRSPFHHDLAIHVYLFVRVSNEGHVFKSRIYYQEDYFIDIIRRWKQFSRKRVETRAANTIRRFYFDHVVRVLYNPHTRGKGFLKLLDSYAPLRPVEEMDPSH